MSQQDTSGGTPAPRDGWGALNVPRPAKPDPRTVRELAQAGMSKRGLIAISDRKTATNALAGQVEREESPLARVRVFAVVERAAPWAAGTAAVVFVVALLLTGSLGRSIVLTAAAAGGQFLWIIRDWIRDRSAEFKHRD